MTALGDTCLTCKQVLLCSTASIAQPLVCPNCNTEWLYTLASADSRPYAVGFAEIPTTGCPRGPRSMVCPVCKRLHDSLIQFNFDRAAGYSKDEAERRYAELLKHQNEWLEDRRVRLKKRGRYAIHSENLPGWDPSVEE